VADPNVYLGEPQPFNHLQDNPDPDAPGNRRPPSDLLAEGEPRAPRTVPQEKPHSFWPFGRKEEEEVPADFRGNDSAISSGSGTGSTTVANTPMSSSVRLRVTNNGKINLGSGTIIYSVPGLARIITCGHVFRGFNEDSKIEVELLHSGEVHTVLGKSPYHDVDAEIGIIEIPSANVLPVCPVANIARTPKGKDRVFSIGCSGGQDPTVEQLEVTAINRYQGAPNIECTGIPVQGRSGGGLFNSNDEIIGVCFAADPSGKRGIYSGLPVVHDALRQVGLNHLIETPEQVGVFPDSIAAATIQPANNSIPETTPPQSGSSPFDNVASTANNSPLASSRETPFFDQRDVAASLRNNAPVNNTVASGTQFPSGAEGAEIVCIIRPKGADESASRVVIINQASPKLVSYLRGDLGDGTPTVRVGNSPATSTGFTQTATPSHRDVATYSDRDNRTAQMVPALPAISRGNNTIARNEPPLAPELRRPRDFVPTPPMPSIGQPQPGRIVPTSLSQHQQPERYTRSERSRVR